DPLLFHLRDPWGGNQLMSGADRWTNELPKLLESRNANRKFIVTSRSSVLHSAGSYLEQELKPHVVRLEVEHYGPVRLGEIYDLRVRDLSLPVRTRALACRNQVLQALHRPFEVDRFLVALAGESSPNSRDIETLIEQSQIEAIARVVTQQVSVRP